MDYDYYQKVSETGDSAGNLSVKFELEDFLQFVCMRAYSKVHFVKVEILVWKPYHRELPATNLSAG